MDEAGWRIGLLPTRKYRFRLDGNYLVVMMAFVLLFRLMLGCCG